MKMFKLRHYLEACAMYTALGCLKLPGLEQASRSFGAFAAFLGPRLGVTHRARRNLYHAMPELSDTETSDIIRNMWRNLGATLAEYAHLEKFSEDEERVEIKGLKGFEAICAESKSALLISGHFANWEILQITAARLGLDSCAIYRHANNPLIDSYIVGMRARLSGVQQIAKGPKGARELLKCISAGKHVFMLVDQKMNDGVAAHLFGRKAMTTSTPASLAIRTALPVVPVSLERLEGARFRITLHPALHARPSADPLSETTRLTQAINDFLEKDIRARPDQWLWLHNRWPREDMDTALTRKSGPKQGLTTQ